MISTVHAMGVANSARISCYSAVMIKIMHQPPRENGHPGPSPRGGASTGNRHRISSTQRPERSVILGISTFSRPLASAPGRTRTGNLRIRRPMLYPLSYGGVRERLTSLRHQQSGSSPRYDSSQHRPQHQRAITSRSHHHHGTTSNQACGRFCVSSTTSSRTALRTGRNAAVTALQPPCDQSER